MFSYTSLRKCATTYLYQCVCVCLSLDRRHIQIRNMLTRHLEQSNCWSGGLRVWGGGGLIAGDYKPQSSDLVSGFDQTNTKAHSQARAHTHTHRQACVYVCLFSVSVLYSIVCVCEQKYKMLILVCFSCKLFIRAPQ